MKKSGGGSIINMSSIERMVGDRRLAAYDASKGGVRILAKAAALRCVKAGYNIRVNTVHPGFNDTPMVTGFIKVQGGDPSTARKALEMLHPLGHLSEPDDLAYKSSISRPMNRNSLREASSSSTAVLPHNERGIVRNACHVTPSNGEPHEI